MKKMYKILLFLALGIGVFFLFWSANGKPGFTPLMAMRMVEHSYLVKDTEVLLCEDGDNAIVNRRYKNIITADDQYLYYCEMSGKTFLPWWEPGLWEPAATLEAHARGKVISFIPGSVQYRPYGDIRQQFSIPLYLTSETEELPWDSVKAELTFDYRNTDSKEWNCAITYHNRTERNPDGMTVLLFLDDQADIDGTAPDQRLSVITYSLWERLYYFDHADNVPITLTITLYDGTTAVHTESHDLADWRK